MDWYTLAIIIYLACGVVYFAHRDQKKRDADYAASTSRLRRLTQDRNVEHFATALTEQRLSRGPTCL